MPVYLVVETKEILNKATYSEYIQKVPPTVQAFGGEYLARGGQVKVISGDWSPERLIVVKFGSMDTLNSWLNSPEYSAIASLREQSAKTNAIVVEGV